MAPPFHWELKLQQIDDKTSGRHIPPDIIFKIQEEGVIHELSAHKMVMGMVSPVFYEMFFLTDEKPAKQLSVEGTTLAAFSIMRNSIYNVLSMEDSLWGKSVTEVFAILDLVSRYKISELQHIVLDHISSFPLTDHTVLSVACDAMKRSRLDLGGLELLRHCAEFIKPKLSEAQAVFQYLADHVDHKEVVYELLVIMKDLESIGGEANEEIRIPGVEEFDDYVLNFGGEANKEIRMSGVEELEDSMMVTPKTQPIPSPLNTFGIMPRFFVSPTTTRISSEAEPGLRSAKTQSSFVKSNRNRSRINREPGPRDFCLFTPKSGFITKSKEKRQLFRNGDINIKRVASSKKEGFTFDPFKSEGFTSKSEGFTSKSEGFNMARAGTSKLEGFSYKSEGINIGRAGTSKSERINIGRTATSKSERINIGWAGTSKSERINIGRTATSKSEGINIGRTATSKSEGINIGRTATSNSEGINIGRTATSKSERINMARAGISKPERFSSKPEGIDIGRTNALIREASRSLEEVFRSWANEDGKATLRRMDVKDIDAPRLASTKSCDSKSNKENENFENNGDTHLCKVHQKLCTKKIVNKEGDNKGRSFWSCSAGGSCSYFAWADLEHPRCKHGVITVVRVVQKLNHNHGKSFFVCSKKEDRCNFFQWK